MDTNKIIAAALKGDRAGYGDCCDRLDVFK